MEVFDEDLCRLQCYLEPNCVSYNFHKIKQASGTHECDLNNATIEHDEDLVKNESYIYRGAEVRLMFISEEYEILYFILVEAFSKKLRLSIPQPLPLL